MPTLVISATTSVDVTVLGPRLESLGVFLSWLVEGRGLSTPVRGWRTVDLVALEWDADRRRLSLAEALRLSVTLEAIRLRLDDDRIRLALLDLAGATTLVGALSAISVPGNGGGLDLPAPVIERAADLIRALCPNAIVTIGGMPPTHGTRGERFGPMSLPARGLNPQQLAVVRATLDRHLLVNAGAGTGKTHTLAHRIAALVTHEGVAPEHVLALTFTRAAADQIDARLKSLAAGGCATVDFVPVRTFHSLALRILRVAVELRRTWLRPRFAIADEDIMVDAFGHELRCSHVYREASTAIFTDLDDGLSPEERPLIYPPLLDALRNGTVRHGLHLGPATLPMGDLMAELAGHQVLVPAAAVATVWQRYYHELERRNVIDFPGLVCEAARVLDGSPEVRAVVTSSLRVLVVDEFQDTSLAQAKLLGTLTFHGLILNAAGDVDQTVLSFAGASVESFLRFTTTFVDPSRPPPSVLPLEMNYRSAPPILALANGVITKNVGRLEKALVPSPTTRNPAGEYPNVTRVHAENMVLDAIPWLIEAVQALISAGVPRREIAILYRKETAAYPQGTTVREALAEASIPTGEDGVRVLTVHGAKGREFDAVFVLFLDRNQFPDQRCDAEEERRLLYVAITRARHYLHVIGRPSGSAPCFFMETHIAGARARLVERKKVAMELAVRRPDLMAELRAEMERDPLDDDDEVATGFGSFLRRMRSEESEQR